MGNGVPGSAVLESFAVFMPLSRPSAHTPGTALKVCMQWPGEQPSPPSTPHPQPSPGYLRFTLSPCCSSGKTIACFIGQFHLPLLEFIQNTESRTWLQFSVLGRDGLAVKITSCSFTRAKFSYRTYITWLTTTWNGQIQGGSDALFPFPLALIHRCHRYTETHTNK